MVRYRNHVSLLEAGNFIESIESSKGLKVACLEEIVHRMNYIDANQVRKLAEPLKKMVMVNIY